MLEIYTIQLSKARHLLADQYEGVTLIDTTVKSGIKEFAPTWDMVAGSKNGSLSHEDYTEEYVGMMQRSKIANKDVWENYIPWDGKIALACYCRAGHFCHRHILKEIIIQRHNHLGHQAVDMGEITDDL